MGSKDKKHQKQSIAPKPSKNPLVRLWRASQRNAWSRWTLDALILGVAVYAILTWQTRHLIDEGEPAPPFSLVGLDGEVKSLSDYKGEKVLLDFWAPFCSVCAAEAGTIEDVAKDYTVVSVVLDYEDIAEVEAFVKKNGVTIPVLLGTPAVASAYKISSYPTFYIIDAEGKVEDVAIGYTTGPSLKLRMSL